MQRIYGFTSRQIKPLTDLEKRIQTEFVPKEREPYPAEVDKPMMIVSAGGTSYGIYQGLTVNDDFILSPFVRKEFTPYDYSNLNDGVHVFVWEVDRLCYIARRSVSEFIPVDKSYLQKLVDGITAPRPDSMKSENVLSPQIK